MNLALQKYDVSNLEFFERSILEKQICHTIDQVAEKYRKYFDSGRCPSTDPKMLRLFQQYQSWMKFRNDAQKSTKKIFVICEKRLGKEVYTKLMPVFNQWKNKKAKTVSFEREIA